MKINFKKLKSLDAANSAGSVYLDTVRKLLSIVIEENSDSGLSKYPDATIDMAKETLKDLGVIVESGDKKPVQQLNS